MRPHVLLRLTLAALFGTSTAVVVPKHEPRDFPVVNATRVVDNTTIYYPGPVDLRRVRSGPVPANSVLKRTGPHEENKKETHKTDALSKPLPTEFGMAPAGHILPRRIIDMEAVKRREDDSKEDEQSCSCPCQCSTMEGPKKNKKKKLSKGAIAGIVIGSVVGSGLLLYGLLLWLVERFFSW